MTGCPTYQVISGSATIDMASQKMTAPKLGDEQWSQLLTFSDGGQDTVVKQTAIRDGRVLLIVSGSPALVDRNLGKALTRAAAACRTCTAGASARRLDLADGLSDFHGPIQCGALPLGESPVAVPERVVPPRIRS